MVKKYSKILALTTIAACSHSIYGEPSLWNWFFGDDENRTQSARPSNSINVNTIVKESFDYYLPADYEGRCSNNIVNALMQNLGTTEQNDQNGPRMAQIIDRMLGKCAKSYAYDYVSRLGYSSEVANAVALLAEVQVVMARHSGQPRIGHFIDKDTLERDAKNKQQELSQSRQAQGSAASTAYQHAAGAGSNSANSRSNSTHASNRTTPKARGAGSQGAQ